MCWGEFVVFFVSIDVGSGVKVGVGVISGERRGIDGGVGGLLMSLSVRHDVFLLKIWTILVFAYRSFSRTQVVLSLVLVPKLQDILIFHLHISLSRSEPPAMAKSSSIATLLHHTPTDYRRIIELIAKLAPVIT